MEHTGTYKDTEIEAGSSQQSKDFCHEKYTPEESIAGACSLAGNTSKGYGKDQRQHHWTEDDKLEFQEFYEEDVVTESGDAWEKCTKYPGHDGFIPVHEFGLQHLPPEYRDTLYLDYIKCCADLTVRLRMKHSPNRPEASSSIPDSKSSSGTAVVWYVKHMTSEDCFCKRCQTQERKMSGWWKIILSSANHCIYDELEAKKVRVDFFYDDQNSIIENRMKNIQGVKIFFAFQNADTCGLECATHDDDLGELFLSMIKRRSDLKKKIEEYQSSRVETTQTSCVVIISHPHGEPKCITVGEERERYQVKGTYSERLNQASGLAQAFHDHTTRTCKGSSGAGFLRLNGPFNTDIPGSHLRHNSLKPDLNTGCTWEPLKTIQNFSMFLEPTLELYDYMVRIRTSFDILQKLDALKAQSEGSVDKHPKSATNDAGKSNFTDSCGDRDIINDASTFNEVFQKLLPIATQLDENQRLKENRSSEEMAVVPCTFTKASQVVALLNLRSLEQVLTPIGELLQAYSFRVSGEAAKAEVPPATDNEDASKQILQTKVAAEETSERLIPLLERVRRERAGDEIVQPLSEMLEEMVVTFRRLRADICRYDTTGDVSQYFG